MQQVKPKGLTGPQLDELAINTIRTLSIDAVQQAKSGHPGTPMALAPLVYVIWNEVMRFDPQDPIWPNRDRFVLSNGHASMLLWSVLYLTQVQPPSGFDPLFDLSLVLMAFLGGLGTISGPIIGALIIEPGQLYLTIRYTNGYLSEILLGALFLLIVIFVPRGIVPTAGEWLRRLRTRGRPSVAPVQTSPRAETRA